MKKGIVLLALILAALICVLGGEAYAEGGYTVEFFRGDLEYVLPGDTSVPMSEILSALDLSGEVTAVEVSNPSLFSASNETGAWVVSSHQAFSTPEWMKVTINTVVYEITVTDERNVDYGMTVFLDGVRYDAGFPYTGKPIEPEVTVVDYIDNDKRLISETDYTVSYSNNTGSATEVTEATVTITGIGAYVGETTVNFRITPYDIADCVLRGTEAYDNGQGLDYSLSENLQVLNGDTKLLLGTDYSLEIEYADSYEVGQTCQATIQGLGDWGGTQTFTFTVVELHHTVIFDANGGTGTMADGTVANDGHYKGIYYLPACGFTATYGMRFDHWEVNYRDIDEDPVKQPGQYFSAPYIYTESDVQTITVTAFWRELTDDEKVTITASGMEHGSLLLNGEPAELTNDALSLFEGGQITVVPGAGYVIGAVSYNDGTDHLVEPVNGVYSFTMPTVSVTLTATFDYILATPPTIDTQPTDLTLTYGYTDGNVLTVTASGLDGQTLSYQWYSCGDADRTNAQAIDGATGTSYTVPTGKAAGRTEYYYCVVTATRDDNGQTADTSTDVAVLTVEKADFYQTEQIPNITKYVPSDKEGEYTFALPALPVGAAYSFTLSNEDGVIDATPEISAENVLSFTTNSGKTAGTTAVITVKATGAPNYNDYSFNVTAVVSEYTVEYAWPEQESIWLDANNELQWKEAGITLDKSRLTVKNSTGMAITDYTAKVGDTELRSGENTIELAPGAYRIAITGDNGKLDDWVDFRVIELIEDDTLFSLHVPDYTWPLVGEGGTNAATTPPVNRATLLCNGREITYSTDENLEVFLTENPGLKLWFEYNDDMYGEEAVDLEFIISNTDDGDFYNMPYPRTFPFTFNYYGRTEATGEDDQLVFLPNGVSFRQLTDDDGEPVPASSAGGSIYYMSADPPELHYTEGPDGTAWALWNGDQIVPDTHYFRDSAGNVWYGNGSDYTLYNAKSSDGNFISFTPLRYTLDVSPHPFTLGDIEEDEGRFYINIHGEKKAFPVSGDNYGLVGKDFFELAGGLVYTGDTEPYVESSDTYVGLHVVKVGNFTFSPELMPILWMKNTSISEFVDKETEAEDLSPHAYARYSVDDFHYQIADCRYTYFPNNSLVEIQGLKSEYKAGEDITCEVVLIGPRSAHADVFLNGELFTTLDGTRTHELQIQGLREGTYEMSVYINNDKYVIGYNTTTRFEVVRTDPVLTLTGTTPTGETFADGEEIPYDPENFIVVNAANDVTISGTNCKWTISDTDVVGQDHIEDKSAEDSVSSETIYLKTLGLGEVTLTARFSGNAIYNLSRESISFTVVPMQVASPIIEVVGEDQIYYDGQSKTPEVKVYYAEGKEIPAAQYTVTYKNNTDITTTNSKAKVSVKSIDSALYTFDAERTFDILGHVTVADGIEHGTVAVSGGRSGFNGGETVTLTVTPASDYVIDTVSYNDGADNYTITPTEGVYSFTMPTSHVTVSAVFITEWAWLQQQINTAAAQEGGGTVSLDHDYTTLEGDEQLVVLSGNPVTLDLNGHTLDRRLAAGNAVSNGYVIVVPENGSLTITDSSAGQTGKITGGNNTGNGGGVLVKTGGVFTLSGGSISSNTAYDGGGVYVCEGGSFDMSGGSISGNTAITNGGGVYVGGTFTISGNPTIIGNTEGTDERAKASNVYLINNKTITVGGALTNTTPIGIRMETPDVFTSGSTDALKAGDYIDCFTSESDNHIVKADGRELKLAPHVHDDITFLHWTATDSLPDTADNWCLMADVTLSSAWVVPEGTTKLCLNGHSIVLGDGVQNSKVITVGQGATLNLYDCQDNDAHTHKYIHIVESDESSFTEDPEPIDVIMSQMDNSGLAVLVDDDYTGEGVKTFTGGYITGGNNGGVYVDGGSFTMAGGTIIGNTAEYGGGVYVCKGGSFTLSGGAIIGNTAVDSDENPRMGGGVYVDGGSLTLSGGAISGNTAYDGGGVYVCEGGSFDMSGGSIIGNTAITNGGAAYLTSVSEGENNESFTMSGGTISGNTAYLGSVCIPGGTFTMTGGTISGNAARYAGGGVSVLALYEDAKGDKHEVETEFIMSGGTIENNCVGHAGGGVYIGETENASDDSTHDDTTTTENNKNRTSFKMSGGTITNNRVVNTIHGHGGGVELYGKFEMSGEAMITDNTAYDGGGVYCDGASLGITMSGGTISGNTAYDVGGGVSIEGDAFNMSGGTISENKAVRGAGVYVGGEKCVFNMSGKALITRNTGMAIDGEWAGNNITIPSLGGGVYFIIDTFTMSGEAKITHNMADYGGGVYVGGKTQTFTVEDGVEITDNTAYDGGGVYIQSGNFIMTGGKVSNNKAESGGGGVKVDTVVDEASVGFKLEDASFEMRGGEITRNTADIGGGVYVIGENTGGEDDEEQTIAVFTMSGGTISDNTADTSGGGVYVIGEYTDTEGTVHEIASAFTMSAGTITENTVGDCGGGVYIGEGEASFTMSGDPTITGNTEGTGESAKASNVYLINNKTITVGGALTNTTPIGIRMETPDVFTSGLSGRGTAANFFSDDDAYAAVGTAMGECMLAVPLHVTLPADSKMGTVRITDISGTPVTEPPAYVLHNDIITLTVTPAEDYVPTNVSVTYTDEDNQLQSVAVIQDEGDEPNTWSFLMPAYDVSLSAVYKKPVSVTFVNYDGSTLTEQAIPIDSTMTSLANGFYVVNEDVVFDSPVSLHDSVYLILCNGKTMSVGTEETPLQGKNGIFSNGHGFVVYGASMDKQECGTLKVFCTGSGETGFGIAVNSYSQHTGNVYVRSSQEGIFTGEAASFYGGTLDVASSDKSGVFATSALTISGGQINAAGKSADESTAGLRGFDTVTLGYTNITDFIHADRYLAKNGVSVADGQTLSDGTNIFSGTISDLSDIAGKTLVPVHRVLIAENIANGTVTADKTVFTGSAGDRTVTLTVAPATGYMRDSLSVTYTNAEGQTQTVELTQDEDTCDWWFTMPAFDVSVTATFSQIPVFGTPTFTLPANIKTIGESAFEGLPMTVVEIPDGCQSIGKWAFKDCTGLTQIRIPASVTTIDTTAFEGCENVFVYGAANSAAKTFCDTHANCTFVAET